MIERSPAALALALALLSPAALAQSSNPGAQAPVVAPAVRPGSPSTLRGLGPLFFNEDSTGVLWVLNPLSGAATNVGASGVTGATVGLAPRDETTLFGTIWSSTHVVMADGSGTTLLGQTPAEGLAYDAANDMLYGAINGSFFEIDPATGIQGATLAVAPGDVEGIAVGNGGVYGLVGFGSADTLLHFYSPATGAWSQVGDTGIDWNLVGLAFDPAGGMLYAKGSQDSLLYRIDPTTAATTVVGDTGLGAGGGLAWLAGAAGTSYCGPAVPNSTGSSAVLSATGSSSVVANDLTLVASDIPLNAFGLFLASRTQGNLPQPGGSQGVLCLSGAIGRYVGPGQIQSSGSAGSFSLLLDLTQTPQPNGLVPVAVGETWNFQAWHRDASGTMATSNFTNGVSVTFQ